MRNIIKIFLGDLHKLRRNLVAWAIIIGLLVVPCLYAWFNIDASWDPYGKTGNLKIALANSDEGYDGELLPLHMNFGDNLISKVSTTDKFDWIVTTEEEAIEGTKSGEYYAAVVIPKSFSRDMLSFFSTDVHHSKIVYYVNEKENAIAPILTIKGAKAIQQQVTEAFTASIVEIAYSAAKDIADGSSDKSATKLIGNMTVTVTHVKNIVDSANSSVDALSSSTDSLAALLDSTYDLATVIEDSAKEGSELSKEASADISALLKELDGDVKALNEFLEALKGLGFDVDDLIAEVQALQGNLTDLQDELKSLDESSAKSIDNLNKIAANIKSISRSTKGNLASLKSALDDTSQLLTAFSADMGEVITALDKAAETGNSEALKKFFSQDAESLSSFIASPVSLDKHSVYHIENYGTSMAPFYTTLALWVGVTLLVALMSVTLEESRRRELDNLKEHHIYLGRYILFGIMGIIQALLICTGDLFYLGIQCEHPLLFILAGIYGAIVFGSIVYALTVSFGNIGKAIAVIIMVIQVAGSGGTFPVETAPVFFQKVYPLLPFPHLMDAMREAIAGMYGATYWIELGKLTIFLLAALLLGLVLRKPIIKLNEMFTRKMEDTHLM